MNHIIIQIYEVQTPHEAESLIEMGVDHIGSVLLSEEQWKVPVIQETIRLTKGTNAKATLIPLFSNMDNICRALDYYRPDIIHLCESLADQNGIFETCNELLELQRNVRKRFPEIRIMRAIPIAQSGKGELVPSLEVARLFEPISDYFLTDTLMITSSDDNDTSDQQPVKGFVGITGKTCDWDIAAKLVETSRIPVILAGGISPDNVSDGIRHVRPVGVDSCTATNATGKNGEPIRFKKDLDKVRKLVETVRSL